MRTDGGGFDRVELRLVTPLAMGCAHTHPYTARVVKAQYKDFGESRRPRVVVAAARPSAAA